MQFKLKNELPAIIIAALPAIYLAIIWKTVSEIIPIHWNLSGEIDRYGRKDNLVWLSLFIPFTTYLTFLLSPRLKRNENLNKMGNKYQKLKLALTFLMSILTVIIIQSSKSGQLNTNNLLAILGALFVIVGNFMPTIKYNQNIGIRIPPTLNNEDIWKSTHQYASRIWMIGGGSIIIVALLSSPKFSTVYFLITTAILILLPTIYAYRNAKNR